jgi:hypothetical protein
MAKLGITYENWMKGKLQLDSAISYYKTSGFKPKFVAIELFSVSDQKKIFENQKDYFHQQLNQVHDNWMKSFEVRYTKSREKRLFISRTYSKILKALQGDVKKLIDVGVVILADSELINLQLYQSAITHFNECVVEGTDFTYETIPNPVSREISEHIILPEVYAECLWLMKRHIETNFFGKDKDDVLLNKRVPYRNPNPKTKSSSSSKKSLEKYPDFFRDEAAFDLFNLLVEHLPINKHRIEVLNTIYFALKSKSGDGAIIDGTEVVEYCKFCNRYFKIKGKKASFLKPKNVRNCRNKTVQSAFDKINKEMNLNL